MASLAKWLSFRLRTQWLWVRVQLQSLPTLIAGVGLCNKSGKISDDSHTNERVVGCGKRRRDNDYFITTTESSEDNLKCQNLYQSHHVSILELTKVLGHLTSTIQTVLPVRIYLLSYKQLRIQALKKEGPYKGNIVLSRDSKQELL